MNETLSSNQESHAKSEFNNAPVRAELLLWEYTIIGSNGGRFIEIPVVNRLERILARIVHYARPLNVAAMETLSSEMVAYLEAIRNGGLPLDGSVVLRLLDWRHTFGDLVEDFNIIHK